ncbi:hypothetical protein GLOIN_2v1545637 [Rhizophagus irregularis DAOM 181602=DAOM 197198]|uniref:Uncharacterized protein n=1 Tax=Rhizophagus irregularis (strain DAOM 181602 / DAOM 197198 / MUCL 43194) TaxID=747089 RepID=A0A2P4QIY0_RHIID|nr:hypothetical protein GLOIN_2v1545637 [Rhizophagus irregularis DAOM 181602=DAOM 197198]POG77576.1 hypothetical protein GLOIN_2v1545637 [Rhizophagus irregularis DAOM 181602=DAOM 197198]GET54442.1 hypothetical protein GLOIN_2v1545637 [Rhizophagus irregularis DAOM 181602=DAOM 197198]|eukprot:XP_025184442.1 hypothetical protein GLOIN_2v1545637 [Rhizophagus irregularis DAOM 181602=DAOM 197198]
MRDILFFSYLVPMTSVIIVKDFLDKNQNTNITRSLFSISNIIFDLFDKNHFISSDLQKNFLFEKLCNFI